MFLYEQIHPLATHTLFCRMFEVVWSKHEPVQYKQLGSLNMFLCKPVKWISYFGEFPNAKIKFLTRELASLCRRRAELSFTNKTFYKVWTSKFCLFMNWKCQTKLARDEYISCK